MEKSKIVLRAPLERKGHSMIYNESRNRIILFGGKNSGFYFNDTWILDLKNFSWSRLITNNSPEPRCYFRTIYYPESNCIFLFGGVNDTKVFNDLWIFDLSRENWYEIHCDNSPNPRHSFLMVYDQRRHRILIHGGAFEEERYKSKIYDDIWSLSLDSFDRHKVFSKKIVLHWSQLNVFKSLSRSSHIGIISGNLFYIFGGYTGLKGSSDLWIYDLSKKDIPRLKIKRSIEWPVNCNEDPCYFYSRIHNCIYIFSGGFSPQKELWKLVLESSEGFPEFYNISDSLCDIKYIKPRNKAGFAYNYSKKELIIFGGNIDINNSESLEFGDLVSIKF